MSIDQLPEDVQRRMIEKLLGKDNAKALETRKEGDRRFRPKPVVISYEFYECPGRTYYSWHINRIENGRKETHKGMLDKAECIAEVKALRAKGLTVRELRIGFPSQYANRTSPKGSTVVPSKRLLVIEQLKNFKI